MREFTEQDAARLAHLEAAFEEAGGRSVELAEEIDLLRRLREPRVIKLRVENAYTDGHESEHTAMVPAPATEDEVDDWWEDTVFNETGDGHGDGSHGRLGSCYIVTILEAPADTPVSVGDTNEWVD